MDLSSKNDKELLLPTEHTPSSPADPEDASSRSFVQRNLSLLITGFLTAATFSASMLSGLTFDKSVCATVIFGTMAAMAVFNISSDLAMFTSAVVLLTTETIDRDDFLKGFGNSSVVCVGLLLVVAKGVEETGALERLVKAFLGKPRSRTMAQLAMMVPVLLISAFLSNTACVAMMIPIVQSWSDSIGVSRSQLLLPLSYVSMMGGCLSLIGSSNNLVAYEKAKDYSNNPDNYPDGVTKPIEIGMFTIAYAGIPMIIAGIIYMVIFSPKLLPNDVEETKAAGVSPSAVAVDGRYSMCFWVRPSKTGVPNDVYHKTPREAAFDRPMLTLVARHRSDLDSGENLGMDEPLQDGELLIFKGTAGRLSQLQKTPGLGLATKEIEKLSFARTKDKAKSSNSLSKRRHRRMVEAVVGVNSPLVGKTVKEVAFRQQFNAVIIARRHGVLPGFRTSVATSSSPSRRTLSRDIDGARQSLGGGLLSDELNAVADVEDGGVPATNKGKTNNVCLDSKNCDCNTSWSKTRFCPGDSLLLVASTGFAKQFSSNSRFFALATEIADSKPPRQDSAKDIGRAAITWVMLAAIIGVSAVNDEYLLEMCCITISVQIYLKIMTLDEAWGAVKSSTLLTIAASFSLGTAIQKSGLAEDIADLIGKVAGPFGHIGLIAVVGFVTSLLSIMVSNTAVVIFLFDPVAEAAKNANMDLLPLVYVLMIASSAAYATPISYQTNLMVYAPGGYVFSDYLKFGGPLQIISWVSWTLAIYVIWG
ncbi:hypothetical protein TeGR_g4533 [Tetraparma gracilis]|uniref:Citrate transporter-like domain-containing protein n=1 Tax=Tetraparma gracilis TaxID=2962635 RepID=A0ABQ6N727_9STRA|nr:hypothetical protein TeGR_g4533 [Tetraparma gracilis]